MPGGGAKWVCLLGKEKAPDTSTNKLVRHVRKINTGGRGVHKMDTQKPD